MSHAPLPDFGPLPAEPLAIEQAILVGGVIRVAQEQPEEMQPRLDSFAIFVATLKTLVNELDFAMRG